MQFERDFFFNRDLRSKWKARGASKAQLASWVAKGELREAKVSNELPDYQNSRCVSLDHLSEPAIHAITGHLALCGGMTLEEIDTLILEPNKASDRLSGIEIEALPQFLYRSPWTAMVVKDVYAKRAGKRKDIGEQSTLFYDFDHCLRLLLAPRGDGVFYVVSFNLAGDWIFPTEEVEAFEHRKMSGPLSVSSSNKRRTSVFEQQEATLLECISKLGYKPSAIPVTPGIEGAKREIRAHCLRAHPGLFTESSFKNCWERLRADRRISDLE